MTVKLVLFLIGASILPLLIVGMTSYDTSRTVIQREISDYTQALLIRQEEYLELLLESIESLIANVSGVEEIRKVLLDKNLSKDTYTQLSTHAKIGYILNGYLNLKGLVSIDIFVMNGAHYHVGDTLSTANIDRATQQRIYQETFQSDKLVLWTGIEDNINVDSTHKKVVTAAKLLKVINNEKLQEEPLGLLVVTYSTDSIYDHFSKMDLGKGSYMMIVDTKNRLIFHPNKEMIGSRLAPSFVAELTHEQGSFVMAIEEQDMLVTYSKSLLSGWALISLVPMENLTASTNTIKNTMIVVVFICVGFISLAAVVLNRTTVDPIKRITEMFKHIQSGQQQFDTLNKIDEHRLLVEHRSDEIGELLRWFNAFLDSLEARQKAEAELRQAKETAEAASQEIAMLNQQLQMDNVRLEKTLQELQTTQEELVRSEKMAVLGQLIAGVAHEINTPLGAIRASIDNTMDILEHTLKELPKLFRILSLEQQEMFFALLDHSLQASEKPSMREIRSYKRQIRQQLEEFGISEYTDTIADLLIDMEIYCTIEPFIPLFQHSDRAFIIQIAYDLSGLQKNGHTITLAVERASKIVFALKNYARYDQDGQKISADVRDGLETVLTLYHNQLKQGVEVIRHYQPVPATMCYPDELNQVWTNLIHNALQAMNYKGTLTIETEQNHTTIVVSITDSGSGIPPEIQSQIFEPFFTTKAAGEGSGLGLSIVKKIIQKHEGCIDVESQPGKTTFRVQLPIL